MCRRVWIYSSLFNQDPVGEHLGCFQFFSFIKNIQLALGNFLLKKILPCFIYLLFAHIYLFGCVGSSRASHKLWWSGFRAQELRGCSPWGSLFPGTRGLSVTTRGLLFVGLRCMGFSLRWNLLLPSPGSRRAGSVVVAHRLIWPKARGIFSDQGSIQCPLHRQVDS